MDVRFVKGIGPKKASALAKLNIFDVQDIFTFFPRNYEDRSKISALKDAILGENYCFALCVASSPKTVMRKGGSIFTNFSAFDDSGTIEILFFNNKYIKDKFILGEQYIFFGKITNNAGKRQMINPIFEDTDNAGYKTLKIEPIYPLVSGISSKDIKKLAEYALNNEERPSEILPYDIFSKLSLMPSGEAFLQIHMPDSLENAYKARRRMIFDELLLLCLSLEKLKVKRKQYSGKIYSNLCLDDFWENIPFPPTNAQKRAVDDIICDIKEGKIMSRIVQGDVGSGKTLIALALCKLSFQNGFQSAVMAPTEILAMQHYETFSELLSPLGINVVLLTGAFTPKQKREALSKIESGEADVIIGTHSLISDSVVFANLGSVIADEQHKFGVDARASLYAKGNSPHVLIMSATPIPRSLALIIYGDLDLSVIDELPPGRTPIKTYAVDKNKHDRIYTFIKKLVKEGRQAYIVCPMIAENAEYDDSLYDVESYYETLSKTVFSDLNIAALHGKTNKHDKSKIMQDFIQGDIDVLIATTVIEVGINVPNAAVMVIEDGHRFGLSGLHQLRGRVGRGSYESYCIVFGIDKGENARERLKIFASTNDGFKIASEDLRIRGPGDFFGTKQHGLPSLKIADLTEDMEILNIAKQTAKLLLDMDITLNEFPQLLDKIEKMVDDVKT